MGDLLVAILPLAVGVASSPLGIIAVIVVLFTARPVRNGFAFCVGWFAAIAVIFVIAYAITSAFDVQRPDAPPRWVAIIHLLIGTVLLLTAVWFWRSGRARVRRAAAAERPADVVSAAPQLPRWLDSVPHYRTVRCFLLGIMLCAVSPVDASCIIGAALDVRVSDASGGAIAIALIVFTVIGMSTVLGPVLYVAARGPGATGLLIAVRAWLARHNGDVAIALFFLVAISQFVKGIQQL